MNLVLEETRKEFRVEVPVEAFRKFLADEIACDELDRQLNAIVGLDKLEYSGHFGSAIYFRLECEEDSSEKRKLITDRIQKVMKQFI